MEKIKKRYIDIDYAKGFAIILVVLGHVVARGYPLDNNWFAYVKQSIYLFHMGFFMFISGWVFFEVKPFAIDSNFILKRFYRLIIPFYLVAVIVIFGKIFFSSFLFVDNPVNDISTAFKGVIWDTSHSKVNFIWYIYVLFVYNILTLFLLRLTKNETFPLLILSFVMYFIQPPQIMYLDSIFKYYFFFILGCFFLTKQESYYKIIDDYSICFIFLFIVLLCVANTLFLFNVSFNYLYLYLIVGVTSIPALHAFIRSDFIKNNFGFLKTIGKYCLTIYLLNVIIIGLIKGIMLRFFPWDGVNFLIYLPILFFSGLLLPIYIWELILKRIPLISKITI